MADVKTKQFFGTAQTIFNYATADLAAATFSGAGSAWGGAAFNNTNDGSVPYATHANAMLECDFASAPAAGAVVELWAMLLNVDSTDDDTDVPASAASGGGRFLGAWPMAASAGLQRRTIVISLEGVNEAEFYVKNSTAVAMDNDGGTSALVVKITPFTYGVTTA
jgi:hypothetical protein